MQIYGNPIDTFHIVVYFETDICMHNYIPKDSNEDDPMVPLVKTE